LSQTPRRQAPPKECPLSASKRSWCCR
jgi:hypothetical protein